MYAVIFTSRLRPEATDYGVVADEIEKRVEGMPGFIRMESVRKPDGHGITICYWESLEAIHAWRNQSEHQEAQRQGIQRFYERYYVCVSKVEYEYERKMVDG